MDSTGYLGFTGCLVVSGFTDYRDSTSFLGFIGFAAVIFITFLGSITPHGNLKKKHKCITPWPARSAAGKRTNILLGGGGRESVMPPSLSRAEKIITALGNFFRRAEKVSSGRRRSRRSESHFCAVMVRGRDGSESRLGFGRFNSLGKFHRLSDILVGPLIFACA